MNTREKAKPTSFGESMRVIAVFDGIIGLKKEPLATMFPDNIINPRAKLKDYIVDGM